MKVMLFSFILLQGIVHSGHADEALLMATTTSTDNTGLLDYLAPFFEDETGLELLWTAVGTGKALMLGQNCDVDLLMVHAPQAELEFVRRGFGIQRRQIMYNDFVIVGPEKDPAGVEGIQVSEVLSAIAETGSFFASRGDDSGTHKKERLLWEEAGLALPERESWYIQTGQGMLNTLQIASEMQAYTLTDRATYIIYEENQGRTSRLVVLVEGDASLRNQYSVIAVSPSHCSKTNYAAAKRFIEWIVSEEAQGLIGDFRLKGTQLFTPNAGGE
jgi:tungstate transport system substrate-binding protein